MKRLFALSLLPWLLFAGPVLAQTSDKAESTVELGPQAEGVHFHAVNRDFLFASEMHWGDPAPTRFLMRMTTDINIRDDAEGFGPSSVSVTAWRYEGASLHQLWTFKEPGDKGELSTRRAVFIVTTHGCCGGRDSYSVFDIWSGRRLFTATGAGPSDSWAQVEIPNSHGIERLVAFHAAYSMTDDVAFGALKDTTVGLLTYAAPDRPLARYRLTVKSADEVDGFMGEGWVRLREEGKPEDTDSLTLWKVDGKLDPSFLGGFAIRLELRDDKWVVIPVEGDRLQIDRATLPPGLAIRPADLP